MKMTMNQSIMCGSCSTNKSIKSWEIKCTKCGKKGHWANDCTKKK